MPIVVIINNKIKGNSLFCSNSETLVMQSGFAATEDARRGCVCIAEHRIFRPLKGTFWGGVGLCRAAAPHRSCSSSDCRTLAGGIAS